MAIIELVVDDFCDDGKCVKVGNVASAIARRLLADGSPNKFQAERDTWPFIHTGIVAEKLHPLDQVNRQLLSVDNSGGGMVLFDELVEWGKWCKRFDFVRQTEIAANGAYVPLFPLLAGYWDKPLSELPKVVQARGGIFTALWDTLSLEQRHELVSQTDYQHAPKTVEEINEGNRGLNIGYYSIKNEWSMWAGKPTLLAEEAIPLMNGCDPESWRNRHNRTFHQQLPDDWVAAIERGLKIAEGEKVGHQSPADWLAWGLRHGLDQPTMKSDTGLGEPDVSMWLLFSDAVAGQRKAKPAAKVEAETGATPGDIEIPGKMPNITIGKLAVKAAWQIECETRKRATASIVIGRLQEWVALDDYPELLQKIAHGVTWATKKGKDNNYDIGACEKTLGTWNASRD